SLDLGLPLTVATVASDYFAWPILAELLPVSFPGVQTKRDPFLTDIDYTSLKQRIEAYFDPAISNSDFFQKYPEANISTPQYDPTATRDYLKQRGMLHSNIVQFAFRPFDT